MIAEIAVQLPETLGRHAAKKLAAAFGVSVRQAKRYLSEPELFPKSRVEQLLAFLDEQDREAERRAKERREERERFATAFREAVGLSGSGLHGAPDRLSRRSLGGAVDGSGQMGTQEGAGE